MLGVGIGIGLKHQNSPYGRYAVVPVALTDENGVVFVNEAGEVLTYGTERVRLPDKVDAILLSSDLCAVETLDGCFLTVKERPSATTACEVDAILLSSDLCAVETLDGCYLAVKEHFSLTTACDFTEEP